MPLIDLKTNLKSLKYGRDQQGGGSSNQPYIESPIPEGYSPKSIDFLLRNGYLAPLNAGKDIIRLSKMFIDTKSINGPLFILKQNLLSRTSVKPFSSPLINQGSYLPTSTLLQAGSGFLGGHIPHLSLPDRLKYYDFTKELNRSEDFVFTNRLSALKYSKIDTRYDSEANKMFQLLYPFSPTVIPEYANLEYFKTNNIPVGETNKNIILSYPGGPGSIGGIGNTVIKFASERTGINNNKINDYWYKNYIEGKERSVKTTDRTKLKWVNPTKKGASEEYIKRENLNPENNEVLFLNESPILSEGSYSYVSNGWSVRTTKTENYEVNFQSPPTSSQTYDNFLRNSTYRKYLNNTSSYSDNFKETKYFLGDPGSKTRKSLIKGDSLNYKSNISSKYALDKLAALDVGEDEIVNGKKTEDIIDFRINVIGFETLVFRAFLESFSDSYTAQWGNVKYVGRGENFYNYEGFDRNIALSFNVYAQSKGELKSMYNKLNYLASITAPLYTGLGMMKGNIIELTVGNYLYKQPGILKQLNYEISLDASWDIDRQIQMPHMIKVTSFSFIPIHEFTPELNTKPSEDAKRQGNLKYLGQGEFQTLIEKSDAKTLVEPNDNQSLNSFFISRGTRYEDVVQF